MISQPFSPRPSETVSITIAGTSASVTLPVGSQQVRLCNLASETVYINVNAAATTSHMPLPAGAIEVLTIPAPIGGTTAIHAIGTGSTGTLKITPGGGI